MKKILTTWQTWAVFSVLLILVIVASTIYGTYGTGDVERREYLTLEEFNSIDIGMTFDEFKKVQDAKPSKDAELVTEGLYAITYNGKEDHTSATVFLKKENEDDKIGDFVVMDKSQHGLE